MVNLVKQKALLPTSTNLKRADQIPQAASGRRSGGDGSPLVHARSSTQVAGTKDLGDADLDQQLANAQASPNVNTAIKNYRRYMFAEPTKFQSVQWAYRIPTTQPMISVGNRYKIALPASPPLIGN